MIDHMGIKVTNYAKSKLFYDAVFAALGGSMLKQVPLEFTGGKHVVGYGRDHAVFWLHEGASEKSSHYAFSAENRAQVAAFYAAALAAGGKDNGAPGPRPHYHQHYFGAFVFDPDGNNVEAVCHKPE
jgi:catechol 2,3-dioxygenase-like lactoylglutathione lyase family enzyme